MSIVFIFAIVVIIGFSWVALVEHVLTIRHLPAVQRAHADRSFMVFFYCIVPFVTIVSLVLAAVDGKFLATVRSIANGTINATV